MLQIEIIYQKKQEKINLFFMAFLHFIFI